MKRLTFILFAFAMCVSVGVFSCEHETATQGSEFTVDVGDVAQAAVINADNFTDSFMLFEYQCQSFTENTEAVALKVNDDVGDVESLAYVKQSNKSDKTPKRASLTTDLAKNRNARDGLSCGVC